MPQSSSHVAVAFKRRLVVPQSDSHVTVAFNRRLVVPQSGCHVTVTQLLAVAPYRGAQLRSRVVQFPERAVTHPRFACRGLSCVYGMVARIFLCVTSWWLVSSCASLRGGSYLLVRHFVVARILMCVTSLWLVPSCA